MIRTDKATVVEDIKGRFSRMTSAVFLDFTGMTVEEVGKLRNNLSSKGVEYKVVKNTLVKRALEGAPYLPQLGFALKGMTGIAWSYEEPSAAARVVRDFCKENEKLKVKGGLLDGQVLDGRAVESQLATLPSKDEARAMLLATFLAPAQQLVMLLNTPASNFVRVLNAKEQKV
jgi:large subunit ribosomal protein L10